MTQKSTLNDIDAKQRRLFDFFNELSIIHETYDHPAIFTVAEGKDLKKNIPGAHGKTLFLTNKTRNYWLVVVKDDTQTDLKGLSVYLETKRFSFGKPDIMEEMIGVTPGSVTPFALINDKDCHLTVIVDQKLVESDLVVFHPLKNDKSTVISSADLLKFIRSCGHDPIPLTLDKF